MSKGMKQRLQLARILLHDPKILILDEPASDLDPRARIEIRDLLLELRSLGKTVFLSSHILTELADVCTSVAILERGKLVVAGPIAQIAARLAEQRAGQAWAARARRAREARPAATTAAVHRAGQTPGQAGQAGQTAAGGAHPGGDAPQGEGPRARRRPAADPAARRRPGRRRRQAASRRTWSASRTSATIA